MTEHYDTVVDPKTYFKCNFNLNVDVSGQLERCEVKNGNIRRV